MARGQSETLTEREAQIMDIVWRMDRATAEDVREALQDRLHDSTVRTLLRVLESKGYLTHEVRGKAYVYRAAIGRKNVQRSITPIGWATPMSLTSPTQARRRPTPKGDSPSNASSLAMCASPADTAMARRGNPGPTARCSKSGLARPPRPRSAVGAGP